MASTGADREQRRARHAQRVSALRAGRKRAGRPARTSAALLADPFAAIQGDAEFDLAEGAFG